MLHSYIAVHINVRKILFYQFFLQWSFPCASLDLGYFKLFTGLSCRLKWCASMTCTSSRLAAAAFKVNIFLELIITRNSLPWTALDQPTLVKLYLDMSVYIWMNVCSFVCSVEQNFQNILILVKLRLRSNSL